MNILFLCVANSARSQIAEGLAKSMFFGNVQVESAGTAPGVCVNPVAVTILKEIEVDISQYTPKRIADLPETFLRNLDFVITLCEEENCPVLTNKARRIHWPLHDPASDSIQDQSEMFRSTRNELITLIGKFGRENGLC